MHKVKAITHNASNTFFCLPRESSRGNIGTCFKLFSVLDLHEFKFISQKVSKREVVKFVDPWTVTTNIYGVTIFQQFLDSASIISTIKASIQQLYLDPFITSKGVEFDNIFIR